MGFPKAGQDEVSRPVLGNDRSRRSHHPGQCQKDVSLVAYEVVQERGNTVLDRPLQVLDGHRRQQVTRMRALQACRMDQFVGENFVVTVHGPLSPKAPLEAALRETAAVAARLESGRLHPTSPFGLTYTIVSSIARRESEMVAKIAREVGLMEQRVMAEADEDPREFLSQLFAARHELLTIKTTAAQGSEIYRRAIKLTNFAPPEDLDLMKDVLDQYETVAQISDSRLVFLMGVTECYARVPIPR